MIIKMEIQGIPYTFELQLTTQRASDGVGVTDPQILAAAALHDVVEDTDVSIEEVRAEFGDVAASLVAWVTRDPSENKPAYLARLADAPNQVLMLKLADRLSNVQRLATHPRPEKQARYYAETVEWIVPLATRFPWFGAWFAVWQDKFSHLMPSHGDNHGGIPHQRTRSLM
jgi:(p)ppGpp synthase/HD superfamily hydrolase